MPVPPEVLVTYGRAVLQVEDGGDPGTSEAFVLVTPEPPGTPATAKPGPDSREEILRRLRQGGFEHVPVRLVDGAWTGEGALVIGLDRARAVRLGNKMRRWVVVRLAGGARDLLYTGVTRAVEARGQ